MQKLPDLSSYKFDPERKQDKQEPKAKKRERATEDPGLAVTKRPKQWPGPLPPLLEPELNIVFVGFNPGIESGKQGHYYAHHSNRFWKLLFWSGLTAKLHVTSEDVRMPGLYRIGFTDLVSRCTKGIQQLSKEEMSEGVVSLENRIESVKPKAVCLVGKGIWEAIAKVRKWDRKQFKYGKDPSHKFGGESVLYCVPSTSGLNSIPIEKQLAVWREMATEIKSIN